MTLKDHLEAHGDERLVCASYYHRVTMGDTQIERLTAKEPISNSILIVNVSDGRLESIATHLNLDEEGISPQGVFDAIDSFRHYLIEEFVT